MSRAKVTEWSPEEEEKLCKLYSHYQDANYKWSIIGKEMGKKEEACRSHWRVHGMRLEKRIQSSPYPRFDTPLEMEGDALVLPDPEFPFHHADFINRVLDLSQTWGIKQCIIAGDLLHFDSLSDWSPNWQIPNGHGGLDEKQEYDFINFVKTLGSRQQEQGFALLDKIGVKPEDGDPNVSEELKVARKAVKSLTECFDNVDCIMGNHESRLMRQLHSPMFPTEITRLLDVQSWRIAPFYYSILMSGEKRFMIEHPKGAAEGTAQNLSAKYHCSVIMGHSHLLDFTWDISGDFYAIHAGHTVDEYRLAYCGQRHNTKRAHKHGSVIVREGYPWLLHDDTDWKSMEKMK
jgi:predicted phosphodiesterase